MIQSEKSRKKSQFNRYFSPENPKKQKKLKKRPEKAHLSSFSIGIFFFPSHFFLDGKIKATGSKERIQYFQIPKKKHLKKTPKSAFFPFLDPLSPFFCRLKKKSIGELDLSFSFS
eukprot:TRINITY_DN9951_c2_g1_i1.p1 TRINITY_DN9951_c2_g1~~TRINITY_DN9951_c2_g1_i1.p1  ORF type:complete len:115 (-),score=27.56 TRINITY_DN9951_c2_g1_i1:5-349(-)